MPRKKAETPPTTGAPKGKKTDKPDPLDLVKTAPKLLPRGPLAAVAAALCAESYAGRMGDIIAVAAKYKDGVWVVTGKVEADTAEVSQRVGPEQPPLMAGEELNPVATLKKMLVAKMRESGNDWIAVDELDALQARVPGITEMEANNAYEAAQEEVRENDITRAAAMLGAKIEALMRPLKVRELEELCQAHFPKMTKPEMEKAYKQARADIQKHNPKALKPKKKSLRDKLREAFADKVVEQIRELTEAQIEEIHNAVAPSIPKKEAMKLYQEGLAIAQASAT